MTARPKVAGVFALDEWNRIFEANRDILNDPNKIFPGQKLKIPA